MRRVLTVTYADGSTELVRTLTDTPANRRRLDREAWGYLARPSVLAAKMDTLRDPTRGDGRYR